MVNKNDNRILELKKKIEHDRATLKETNSRFQPITSCTPDFAGQKYNLNAMSANDLLLLLGTLSVMEQVTTKVAEEMQFIKPATVNGYLLAEWTIDIRKKLDQVLYREKKAKLDKLEKQLTDLLTGETQTKLKVDNLENNVDLNGHEVAIDVKVVK